MKDNLYLSAEAREKLISGIKRASQAVAITMGTSGANSLLEALEAPHYFPTNDGFSILNSIHFADPMEELGRRILCEAVNKSNRISGDGSSTCCVITSEIISEGMKYIDQTSPMELKRSLERCIPLIEAAIEKQKKSIIVDGQIDFTLLEQVATISSEDPSIGKMIADIYRKIGKDGVISWDVSKTTEDSYSIGTGLTMHGGTYASRYMCDLTEQGFTNQAKLDNPYVLLARKKITSIQDLNNITELVFTSDNTSSLLVFCEEIDPLVVNALLKARQGVQFRCVVVKMPVLFADEWWEDLAAASGGMLIDTMSGMKMANLQLKHLGRFDHVTVDKEDTFIDGIKDLSKHVLALQVSNEDQALNRIARLNTKTARYLVGAHSESAIRQRRDKVEDAIGASSIALEEGIVAGGGVALSMASNVLSNSDIAGKILRVALNKPMVQIMYNAGIESKEYQLKNDEGFDSRTGKIVNMFDAGIIDPAGLVLNAVRNAIGVASGIITCGTVVLLPREDPQPQNNQVIMR